MNSTTVNLQQQSYNHQKNIGNNSSDPYFQQMIGNRGQENKLNSARLSNSHQYDSITVNDANAPPPIPPPPIITPTNTNQGPSWC